MTIKSSSGNIPDYIPVITADGSATLFTSQYRAHYHSLNGALQESLHIFINAGFNYIKKPEIKVLEVGYGTGLNALLTAIEADKRRVKTIYHGIDKHPLTSKLIDQLNYQSNLDNQGGLFLEKIKSAPWNEIFLVNSFFTILKIDADIIKYDIPESFDVIYFDAFAPDDQPEIWQPEVFKKLFSCLHPNGILVTYCSKGIVKRTLRDTGFSVERLSGPPGKRHMIRAIK